MNFEWDEMKRQANISKHGIDFADAIRNERTIRLVSARKATKNEQKRFFT